MQPLSILCRSFKDIDMYTTGFPRGDGQGLPNIFRTVKHCLPGPVSVADYTVLSLLLVSFELKGFRIKDSVFDIHCIQMPSSLFQLKDLKI